MNDEILSFKETEIKLKQLDEIRRQIIERMNLEMKLAIEKKYHKIEEILARAKRDNDKVDELINKISSSLGFNDLGFPR